MDAATIQQVIKTNEQTARAMRERSALSLHEAGEREEQNVELRKQLAELEKTPKK